MATNTAGGPQDSRAARTGSLNRHMQLVHARRPWRRACIGPGSAQALSSGPLLVGQLRKALLAACNRTRQPEFPGKKQDHCQNVG